MILLVGYGYWGKNLARNFSSELVAVCDQDDNRLNAAKALYKNVSLYNDYETALKDPNVKAVVLATKANTHYDLAVKALEYNKDVWIEKPVCETLEQTKNLQKLSEKTKKIIFVDHTFCYHPAVHALKNIDIGSPLYYDSTRISLGLFQPDVDVLLDLAVHDASIINFLYPNLELKDKSISKNFHVNETANQVILNLTFTNGFTANINANWVSPVKVRQIILAGKKSSVIYDDLSDHKIKIYETGIIDKDFNATKLGAVHNHSVAEGEALYIARTHFLECVEKRTQPVTNIASAYKILEWLL